MKKLLLLCSIIISILSAINAQEYKGTINDYVPIADDEIELQHHGATIYFYWKISTLFGEPIVYGSNATIVKSTFSTMNVIDLAGKYCTNGTSIPSSILKKVRVKSVVLNGIDKKTGGAPSYKIKIDAGIPSQVYIGTYEQLKAAPKDTRKKYWSFNVAGSPSWSKLFKHLSATQAKQLFKSGIKLKACGDGPYQSHLSVEWDLSAVKEYLIKLKQVKLDKELAIANKLKTQLAKKEPLRKQKEADDFWNTPVNTDTQQDQTDRKTIKRKVEQFANKKQKIASTKKAVLREKEKVEKYWAAKCNKLKNTPKPIENKEKGVFYYSKMTDGSTVYEVGKPHPYFSMAAWRNIKSIKLKIGKQANNEYYFCIKVYSDEDDIVIESNYHNVKWDGLNIKAPRRNVVAGNYIKGAIGTVTREKSVFHFSDESDFYSDYQTIELFY